MDVTSRNIMTRDWTELNPELLLLISRKLGNLSNFIRFRSVCKQWRSVADSAKHPPQLPWLLQPANLGRTEKHTETDYILYSLSSNTTFDIKLPITHREYRYYHCKEPSIGYILVDQFKHHKCPYNLQFPYLFNPITKTEIHLPFSNPTHYSSVYMGPDDKSTSGTVTSGAHLIAYADLNEGTEIASWRSFSNEFVTFKIPIRGFAYGYYKGKLFVHEFKTRETSVFNMSTGAKMNIVIPHPTECRQFRFFVEAMGELLAVENYLCGCESDNLQLKVYQLEHTDDFGRCRWIKLKGIGDRVMFLGSAPAGFCLSASDFEGLKGNCIYYMRCYHSINQDLNIRLLRYDMESGFSEELLDCVAPSATWFMPCLS